MAASLMWRGVGKCGSPAPKSTRLAPWARSLAASAATAMVAETSMRPMRAAKICEGAATVVVIALLSWQILGEGPTWNGINGESVQKRTGVLRKKGARPRRPSYRRCDPAYFSADRFQRRPAA